MARKILNRLDVAVDGSLSGNYDARSSAPSIIILRRWVIGVLPYDPTLSAHRHTADTGHANASAAKASFKRASRKSIGDVFEADFWPGSLRIFTKGRNFRFLTLAAHKYSRQP